MPQGKLTVIKDAVGHAMSDRSQIIRIALRGEIKKCTAPVLINCLRRERIPNSSIQTFGSPFRKTNRPNPLKIPRDVVDGICLVNDT